MPTSFATYPSLRDKNVLVTGGAEGIDVATVELFVLQGSRVFFLDIADESARKISNKSTRSVPLTVAKNIVYRARLPPLRRHRPGHAQGHG